MLAPPQVTAQAYQTRDCMADRYNVQHDPMCQQLSGSAVACGGRCVHAFGLCAIAQRWRLGWLVLPLPR